MRNKIIKYPLLIAEIYSRFGSKKNFLKQYNSKYAKGFTEPSLCKKLSGESDFKRSEIMNLKDFFQLDSEKTAQIFLT